jgi:transcriptional regulator GlxA family with amidase domain
VKKPVAVTVFPPATGVGARASQAREYRNGNRFSAREYGRCCRFLAGFLVAMILTAGAGPVAEEERAGSARRGPRAIAFLVVDGVYNTELTAPLDVLQHIRFHSRDDWPETFLVSPDGKPVRTFEGIVVAADHSFETAPPVDVLVVPSAEHSMNSDLDDGRLIGWVRETGRRARAVISLCDGAFVLAKAGLLDGAEATTFPADQDRFAAMFPQVRLVRGVSFVDGGHALTSVGGAKSFDVALWWVERTYGRNVAEGIGRGLVIAWDAAAIPHR